MPKLKLDLLPASLLARTTRRGVCGYIPIVPLAAFTAAGRAFHSLNAVGGNPVLVPIDIEATRIAARCGTARQHRSNHNP